MGLIIECISPLSLALSSPLTFFLLLFSSSAHFASAAAIYSFMPVTTTDERQLPQRMRDTVRLEPGGSTTISYRRGGMQAVQLYFELPVGATGFSFTVTIDSLDACTCVTQSVYENIMAFAWNRRWPDRLEPDELIYLSWNYWHNTLRANKADQKDADPPGVEDDRREFFFSATNSRGFGSNADPSPSMWTELSGWQRRARIDILHAKNGSDGLLIMHYGGRKQEMVVLNSTRIEEIGGGRRRRLRFRLISQNELAQMHPWLHHMANDQTPRCDWTLNFGPELRLLIPVNNVTEAASDIGRTKNNLEEDIAECPDD